MQQEKKLLSAMSCSSNPMKSLLIFGENLENDSSEFCNARTSSCVIPQTSRVIRDGNGMDKKYSMLKANTSTGGSGDLGRVAQW